MGMFDEFHFHEPLRCAHGHEVHHVQTKDLGNHMDHYHVAEGRVFLMLKGIDDDDQAEVTLRIEGDTLVRTQVERLPPARLRNGDVYVYSPCQKCEPVFTEEASTYRDHLAEHYPWCAWTLTVTDDRIVGIDSSRVETREDVRKKLAKQGSTPLPDDDRAVQRALARWRERG